jgi:hypothetical protein
VPPTWSSPSPRSQMSCRRAPTSTTSRRPILTAVRSAHRHARAVPAGCLHGRTPARRQWRPVACSVRPGLPACGDPQVPRPSWEAVGARDDMTKASGPPSGGPRRVRGRHRLCSTSPPAPPRAATLPAQPLGRRRVVPPRLRRPVLAPPPGRHRPPGSPPPASFLSPRPAAGIVSLAPRAAGVAVVTRRRLSPAAPAGPHDHADDRPRATTAQATRASSAAHRASADRRGSPRTARRRQPGSAEPRRRLNPSVLQQRAAEPQRSFVDGCSL